MFLSQETYTFDTGNFNETISSSFFAGGSVVFRNIR